SSGPVAFSPDGKRIASGRDGVKVWDAQTGQELLTLKGHTEGVSSVAFSPDGSRIASGSHDQTVKVWDARKSQHLLTLKGHANVVTSVAFSPDGNQVFGQYGNPVRRPPVPSVILAWDARSGRLLPDAPKVMPADMRVVAVHGDLRAYADGRLIRIERI